MRTVTMRRWPLLLLLALLVVAGPALAAGEWAGAWEMHWRGSGGQLVFEQDGDKVTGRYPLYNGRIEGTVTRDGAGSRLEARWTVGSRSGGLIAVMSRDGLTFTGRFDDGEWWTGTRTTSPPLASAIGQRTPRDAFARFVSAGNVAAAGVDDDAWGIAADVVDFGAATATMARTEQLYLVRKLFALVELTTFRYWSVPQPPPGADAADLRLEQSRTGVVLELKMKRDADGNWRIVMPTASEMQAASTALVAAYGGKLPPADAFRRLQNPRDTMRAFLAGMADWDGAGRALALSTLNMSEVPELLRKANGEISAQFLRRVLHHIGLVGLQGIPNDGTSREPYVHFVHGAGRIVIAPSGPAADAPWQFTPDTIARIRDIYRATETLPPPLAAPPGAIPQSLFFTLRGKVARSAPSLLGRVGEVEYWQSIVALTLAAGALVVAFLGSALIAAGLRRLPGGDEQSRWFRGSLVALIALAIMRPVPGALGLAEGVREYTLPFWGAVICVVAGVVGWHLVRSFGSLLSALAARTATPTDDIVVTLLLATARLTVVIASGLGIAHFLSIPANNMLAGLSIGGLALAFASRETLSNVFGAGILVADRPFRRGDWIKTGDIEGTVELVGIRSTRVRTAQDSVVFVPNGKLVDSTINNYGSSRLRMVKLSLQVAGGGTRERLEAFLAAIRARVVANPAFRKEQVSISISSANDKGVTIDVAAGINADVDEDAVQDALFFDLIRLAGDQGLVLGAGVSA